MANTKGAANYGSAAAPAGAPVAATVGTPVTNPVGGNFRFTNDIQGTGAHHNCSIFCRHHCRCDKSVYVGRCLKWFLDARRRYWYRRRSKHIRGYLCALWIQVSRWTYDWWLIYKPSVVQPVNNFAVLDNSVDSLFIDTSNRPVLIQTFQQISTGEWFAILVLSLQVQGSALLAANKNDGQGNCPNTRRDTATALVNCLATDPTSSGDPDHLIVGDLKSYVITVFKKCWFHGFSSGKSWQLDCITTYSMDNVGK